MNAIFDCEGSNAAKDFGVPNFGWVTPEFSRSGQPNAAGFKWLEKEKGVTAVVKLDLSIEYSDSLEESEFNNKLVLRPLSPFATPDQIIEARKIAAYINTMLTNGRHVCCHCHLGRDRTGLIVGLWRLHYQKVPLSQVEADWTKYGYPFPAYQQMLRNEKA